MLRHDKSSFKFLAQQNKNRHYTYWRRVNKTLERLVIETRCCYYVWFVSHFQLSIIYNAVRGRHFVVVCGCRVEKVLLLCIAAMDGHGFY